MDSVRYFLLSQMPFDNDGVISWDLVMDTINSELVNVYGNLVQRTIAMTDKYFDGIVCDKGATEPVDDDLKAIVKAARDKVFANIDAYRSADALSDIFTVLRRANKYIDETMPWVLAKDENKKDRLATVLYNLTESIVICASLLAPFMPSTSQKLSSNAARLCAPMTSLTSLDCLQTEQPSHKTPNISLQESTLTR